MKDTRYYAELACRILNDGTPYAFNKKIIQATFFSPVVVTRETVATRIVMIDSLYSTNMGLRLFGIEELSAKITEYGSDQDLRGSTLAFLEKGKPTKSFQQLIEATYGFNKSGNSSKIAPSIISKYLYFLTGGQFPILDTLVRESYPKVSKKLGIAHRRLPAAPLEYFKTMYNACQESGVVDVEKFDNLLWLYGKVTNGSLSGVLTVEQYPGMVKAAKLQPDMKSADLDAKLVKFLREKAALKTPQTVFSPDLFEFLRRETGFPQLWRSRTARNGRLRMEPRTGRVYR